MNSPVAWETAGGDSAIIHSGEGVEVRREEKGKGGEIGEREHR